jgi:hypothetical protein
MIARTSALLLLVALAGCQWSGRPDGAAANHSNRDGYSDDQAGTVLNGAEAEIVEPLDGTTPPPAAVVPADAAPADATPTSDQ